MTDDPREKLPNEIREAFEQRDQQSAPSQAMRDQLFARVEASISTMDGPPASSPRLARRALPYAASFAVGAIVGAILYALLAAPSHRERPPQPSITPHATPREASDAGPDAPATGEVRIPIAPPAAAEVHRRSRARESDAGEDTRTAEISQAHDSMLAAERVQVEMARTALRRGEGTDALALLEQHGRDFPQGALREEREALLVLAFATTHQSARAQAQATRFRANFPQSLFLPVVNHAMQSISSQTDGAAPNAP